MTRPVGSLATRVTAWCLLAAGAIPAAAAPQRPPNVVLILMDDMGWRDVGFMGNTFVDTPHLDRLAARGIVFTQAYASAPNCAPTRACLMSGQYPPRHGIYTVVDPRQPPGSPWHKLRAADSRAELAPDVVTLPEALRSRGTRPPSSACGTWAAAEPGRSRRAARGSTPSSSPRPSASPRTPTSTPSATSSPTGSPTRCSASSNDGEPGRSSSTSPTTRSTRPTIRNPTCSRSTTARRPPAATSATTRRRPPRSRRSTATWGGSWSGSNGSASPTTRS
ncbi:MAG: hypothetical protein FJ286_17360 [Planctomycetes bacterium]|nr:hypothetical protein [Planctomycetota bacterium]